MVIFHNEDKTPAETQEQKDAMREALRLAMAEFEAKGGKVKELPPQTYGKKLVGVKNRNKDQPPAIVYEGEEQTVGPGTALKKLDAETNYFKIGKSYLGE